MLATAKRGFYHQKVAVNHELFTNPGARRYNGTYYEWGRWKKLLRHALIRKITAPFALFFMLNGLAACSSDAENAAQAGLRAQQAFDARNFYEARKAVTEAISYRDDDPNLHILKGRIELASDRRTDAYLAYSDALSLEATNPEALQAVSQLGLQTGHLREAEKAADTILSFAPDQPEAMLTKGLIALVKRKYDDASTFAERILDVRPNDEAGLILKARTLALTDRTEEALEIMTQAGALNRNSEGINLTLLELYRETGNLPMIIETFERLRESRPDDAGLKIDFANTLYKSGNRERARGLVRSILEAKPTDRITIADIVELWMEYDADPLSPEDFAFLAKDGSIESRIVIARYLLNTGQPEKARQILVSAASGYWPDVRAVYGRTLWALGRQDEALAIANEIYEKDETNADALLIKARKALDDEDFAKAINDAQIVIRDNPQLLDGHLALVDIYKERGDLNSARRIFQDAARLLPQNLILFQEYAGFLMDNNQDRRALSVTRSFARDTSASIKAWLLYRQICGQSSSQTCEGEANRGVQMARTRYARDLPPGTPPTRGLFGRLN